MPDLRARDKPALLQELLSGLKQPGLENECCGVHELLLARERVGTTALGKGLAVPHARTALVTTLSVVIGRSVEGVDYGAPDRKPVHVFFLVLGPNEDPSQLYLSFLSTIVKVFKSRAMKRRLLAAASFEELVGILEDALACE
ncbi:MAG: PTS sugar transporter subunit IIA [Candidatus Eisenbacteria bacterium]|nr:PTS sugar transporter subunit IIA [Candidatus Eisenbacteria bacterium]